MSETGIHARVFSYYLRRASSRLTMNDPPTSEVEEREVEDS